MLGRILLGVTASVVGSLMHALGMTLQKRAHLRLEALSNGTCRHRPWKDAEWQLGLALYLFSSTVPPTVALSILPVFVTAPLAAVGLVANAVFARWLLSSTFAHTDTFGTLLVALGSCLVAVFGAIDEPPLSLEELLKLYRRKAYAAFFALYLLVVAVLVMCELYWRRKHSHSFSQHETHSASASQVVLNSVQTPDDEDLPLLAESPVSSVTSYSSVETASISHEFNNNDNNNNNSNGDRAAEQYTPSGSAGSLYRCHFANETSVLAPEAKTGRKEQLAKYFSGLLSALISGLICSQTLLLAKAGIGLLVLSIHGNMQFNGPLAIAIVAGLIGTALANLYYVQRALLLCSTLTVVPVCYCSSSLAALISSLVYFDQVRLLSIFQIAMISAGIALLAGGVVFLSLKTEDQEGPLRLPPESTSG